ncbi:MAG: hypothetical protein AABX63_04840 [Nanoarchaeota archaeon]
MIQNRNKLIDLLIGNLSNAIVHKILEEAIEDEAVRKHYGRELLNSLEIAKRYREKINPINEPFPERDIVEIKSKIISKVNNELKLRISKGYENINLNAVEKTTNEMLKDSNMIED